MPASAMIVRTLKTANGILEIAQRPFDGYIEVTPMCHATGKRPSDWTRTRFAQEYMEALSLETGIPVSNLVQVIQGRGDSLQQGTWAYPNVAARIAQWCHPPFAVEVDKWVLEILSGRSVHPQRPATTQALVDALDAHDAHFLEHDSHLLVHDQEIADLKKETSSTKNNLIRIEDVYARQQKKQQVSAQRHNKMHRDEAIREKAYRFAGGACMCCARKLWLWKDEAPTPQDVANVDHVDPVNAGGRLTWDDIQVLCPRCHEQKTLAERRLGRADGSKDYRGKHPGFVAACAEQQEKDTLKQIIQLEREAQPLFDGCCLPLRP